MDLKAVFEQIFTLYNQLNKKQKLVILGTIFAVIAFIAFLIIYNTRASSGTNDGYSVLFDNLQPQDAALIIQHLDQNSIPYKLSKEDTILIPKDNVYQERIKLASQGLPKSSDVGFELFDQQEFGATDFDQKIKFLRAIEGELSRTIESLTPIESAAVHIAMPKDSVFVSKDVPPTASVVLNLMQNMVLTPKQVLGIKNLVASSVTKLLPENVSIVDQNGEPLGDADELSTSRELAAAQLKYKQRFEKMYEEKIINILSPFIGGEDRVVAKVTMDFDFSQKQSTQETYDPNSVVRSEQTLDEKREGYKPKEIGGVPGAVSNIGPVQGLDENNIRDKYEKSQTTTNYEIGKTVSSIKGEFATIKRVSAAVVVDGKYELVQNNNLVDELKYIALSQQDLDSITNLVKQAIGFNPERGDEVTVSNFEFHAKTTNFIPMSTTEKILDKLKNLSEPFAPVLKYIIAAIVLLIFYKKVIAPFAERMLEVKTDEEEDMDSLFEMEDEEDDNLNRFQEVKRRVEDQLGISTSISEDEVKYDVLLEKIKDIVEERPEEVANLFQTLVRDELGLDAPQPDFDKIARAG